MGAPIGDNVMAKFATYLHQRIDAESSTHASVSFLVFHLHFKTYLENDIKYESISETARSIAIRIDINRESTIARSIL